MIYSQPMSDGRRAFVLRLNQTVCMVEQAWKYVQFFFQLIIIVSFQNVHTQEADKEEMKEILEMKRSHNKQIQKLKKRNQNNRRNEYDECK